MKTEPSRFKGDALPVESQTWREARDYCAKIGGRLPTEAEWEFAARAGSEKARYGELSSLAWYDSNSGGQSWQVGRKHPSAWGLYDMLGNVWEWTADWYGASYYQQKNVTDPRGASSVLSYNFID